jgi:hypothetical protein
MTFLTLRAMSGETMSQLDVTSWTDEETSVLTEMTIPEVLRRIPELSEYETYETVASAYRYINTPFTPAQAIAWARFAETLGKDVVLSNQEIRRPLSRSELARAVVHREIQRRARAARAAGQEN